jgi:hypothetical protein
MSRGYANRKGLNTTGLNDLERIKKRCPFRDSNSKASTVQPVTRRYLDCAITAKDSGKTHKTFTILCRISSFNSDNFHRNILCLTPPLLALSLSSSGGILCLGPGSSSHLAFTQSQRTQGLMLSLFRGLCNCEREPRQPQRTQRLMLSLLWGSGIKTKMNIRTMLYGHKTRSSGG